MTGCFWEGGPEELAEAVVGFDTGAVDPQACVANARRFDAAVFRESFPREVQAALREGPTSGSRRGRACRAGPLWQAGARPGAQAASAPRRPRRP